MGTASRPELCWYLDLGMSGDGQSRALVDTFLPPPRLWAHLRSCRPQGRGLHGSDEPSWPSSLALGADGQGHWMTLFSCRSTHLGVWQLYTCPPGSHALFPFMSWLDQPLWDQHPLPHSPRSLSVTRITLYFVQKGLTLPWRLSLPSPSCLWLLCVSACADPCISSVQSLHKIFIECPLGARHCC